MRNDDAFFLAFLKLVSRRRKRFGIRRDTCFMAASNFDKAIILPDPGPSVRKKKGIEGAPTTQSYVFYLAVRR